MIIPATFANWSSRILSSRILKAAGVAVLLAACDAPQQINIRPGIGSDVDLDRLRPPSGVTYQFSTEVGGVPQDGTLVLRSRRLGSNRYRYSGDIVLDFPEGANLEEGFNLVAQAFELDGLRAEGSQIFIPLSFTTDNRFRSVYTTDLNGRARHLPHDCFAVLGSCRFRDIQEGGQATIEVETTETGGVWTSVKRVVSSSAPVAPQDRRETLTYSLDRNGVIIDYFVTNREDGKLVTTAYRRKLRN